MPSSLTLDPAGLAPVLEAALQRLGELGQPGLEAFNELIATRGECAEFDAGVDLLSGWVDGDAVSDADLHEIAKHKPVPERPE